MMLSPSNNQTSIAQGRVEEGLLSHLVQFLYAIIFICFFFIPKVQGADLLLDMGGDSGLGNTVPYSTAVDLGSGFPFGINFFGQNFNSVYVNEDGYISLGNYVSAPMPISFPSSPIPMIAPFWADVSTCFDFSDSTACKYYYGYSSQNQFVATWYRVIYDGVSTIDTRNTFQVILTDRSDISPGDFDVEYRYIQLEWTTGDRSGGIDGLGGTPAQVGYDAADGVNFFQHPFAMTDDVLLLDDTSNVGEPGVWRYEIRSGGDIPPSPPVILNYPSIPETTYLSNNTVTLEGTRDSDTSIWNDATEIVPVGSDPWSIAVNLQEGTNNLSITSKSTTGRESDSVDLQFFVDTSAPQILSTEPLDESYFSYDQIPSSLNVSYTEVGSGVDPANSTVTVSKILGSGNQIIDGTTNILSEGGDNYQFQYTPSFTFTEGTYVLTAHIQDLAGQFDDIGISFTIDTTPPTQPSVNPVPSLTNDSVLVLSGTKEADTGIKINGEEVIPIGSETTWSYSLTLSEGLNIIDVNAFDRAYNESFVVKLYTELDTFPPYPIVLNAYGTGSGTDVYMSWRPYYTNDVVDSWWVYVEDAPFTDTASLTPVAVLPSDARHYTINDLYRGQTLYLAVISMDALGNAYTTVSPTIVTTIDTHAPEEVENIQVQSFQDSLTINWTGSADTAGDLDGYTIYVDDDTIGTTVDAYTTSYELTGLNPATVYNIKITARDATGNESTGTTNTAVTLMPNPTGLASEPHNSMVALTWDAVLPTTSIKGYAIYASETNFTSIAGMSPRLVVDGSNTSAQIAGLTNGVTYYFAVTTINLSDGETDAVTTISDTPETDILGPVLSDLRFNDTPVTDGMNITSSGSLTVTATDDSNMSRVEFILDGTLLTSDANGSSSYSSDLDIKQISDGSHTLTVTAYDTLNNTTTISDTINVSLAPPPAPQVTSPQNGLATNIGTLNVEGNSETDTEVLLYNNSVQVAGPISVDLTGHFNLAVTLDDGSNSLTVAAQNRGGAGPQSNPVIVTLDTSIPSSPTALTGQSLTSGRIKLSWVGSTDSRTVGYDLYRSNNAFTSINEASKVNATPLTVTSYEDIPSVDGEYYYRVVAVNNLGTPSVPSNQVQGTSDNIMPRAVSIDYTPHGAFDAGSGRIAPGLVDARVTVNEQLLTTPFLTIAPANGVPLIVSLTKINDTEYTGQFEITEYTPTGVAYAVFSARDLVGNRGTDIDSGATLQIDTDGPAITELTIAPQTPIKNDQTYPATVSVDFTLNDAQQSGTIPSISYKLGDRPDKPITNLVQSDTLKWHASFTLPADGGLSTPENLQFVYQSVDDLGNPGNTISADNLFQVYQGDLPPLSTPLNLKAVALPGGKVALSWDPVEGADDYQLYRKGPGESSFSEQFRTSGSYHYNVSTLVDGEYFYTVASVRSANGQEAVSAQSAPVSATADRVSPNSPESLTLELVGSGVKATWQEPSGNTEDLTYTLYRGNGNPLTEISTLTKVQENIVANEQGILGFIDTNPNPQEASYVVTALDEVGNESVPSTTQYLNIDLLPVSTLDVNWNGSDYPVISWSAPAGSTISGYNLYLGTSVDPTSKINGALITETTYIDSGFSGESRTYTVSAVDGSGVESIGRTVVLPVLHTTINSGQIKRGIMNRLEYLVENSTSEAVSGVHLEVNVGSHQHTTLPVSVPAGETVTVPVIVGGFDDLPNPVQVATTTVALAATGETARLSQSEDRAVGEGALVLSLETQNFAKGTIGKARFVLQNTSDVETDIITATYNGNAASNEVRMKLLDPDGNVLAAKNLKQAIGTNIISLSNGTTVARIPAGASFTSDWIELTVPSNSGDKLTLQSDIDAFHYHTGATDQVTIGGLSSRLDVPLTDTAYYATVDNIDPASSFGDVPIVISGKAIDRITSEPLASANVKLVISVQGFERTYSVLTDGSGNYSYSFTPMQNEAGIYTVSAIHPDLVERPQQGQFTINRITVKPTTLNVKVARNYPHSMPIQVSTAPGTTATNLHLSYDAANQPDGQLTPGVNITLSNPVNVGSSQSATLTATISGDNTAPASGTLKLAVYADETGNEPLQLITVNYEFVEAIPALYFSPTLVNTGVVYDSSVSESVVLENRGLADMNDVELSLLDDNDNPAPSWIYLTTNTSVGDLKVGDKYTVELRATPTSSVTQGTHHFKLRVTSANVATTDINVYVTVVTDAIGSALFKATDIYTATLDSNGDPIQGLAGARIYVQNEDILTIEQTQTTDSIGEALFSDLPVGRYRYRASAPNHQDVIGRFSVKAGTAITEQVFLDYNLVTVEWSVNEITISDSYEITLQAVYETNVPAPVVVMEPTSTTLPTMQPGDVFNGEIRITNYGLKRADNVHFTLPADDDYFRYEFMADTLPTSLDAKASVIIPYRIISLSSLEPDGSSSGSGCGVYTKQLREMHDYECAAGLVRTGGSSKLWTRSYGVCESGLSLPTLLQSSGGTSTFSGSSGGGGSTSGYLPPATAIPGAECVPNCENCCKNDESGDGE